MNAFRALAIALIVIGAVMLAYPMLTYTTTDKVLDIGPLEVTKEEKHHVPLPPILGGAALAIGVGLLLTGGKKPAL